MVRHVRGHRDGSTDDEQRAHDEHAGAQAGAEPKRERTSSPER
jgi:hypothetical protein